METENNPRFPEQSHPSKLHGTDNQQAGKEKYIRDAGKIEDYPETSSDQPATMHPDQQQTAANMRPGQQQKNEREDSSYLTDQSGEEKKEDYINTDERQSDLKRRGLDI